MDDIKNPRVENEMFDRVWEDYMSRLLETEVEIYKSRILRMDTEVQRYFNSSALKNVFARVMCMARLSGKARSITQLASILLVSRQAISTIVQECLDRKWIKLVEVRGREKTYYGTSLLVTETNKYIDYVYNLNDKSLIAAHNLVKELLEINPNYTYENRIACAKKITDDSSIIQLNANKGAQNVND